MSGELKSHILQVRNGSGAGIFKALGSEARLEIISLLAGGDRNINEIGLAMGLSQPTVTKHIQILEQAGLVLSEYMPGAQGMQKRCRLRFDQMIVSFESAGITEERMEEVTMPIGLYSHANPIAQCGLANREKMIGFLDIPQAFLEPERASAEILWMSDGYVEYNFPNTLPATVDILRMELIMEACSEAPNYDHDWPSDITVWVNGLEIGTWTCPGDFGAKRGILNPGWWVDHMTQYGALKIWSLDSEGASLDGNPLSGITLDAAGIQPNKPISIRIGIKEDAEHKGGFNLFGKGFGNYAQDLVLRMFYVMGKDRVDTGLPKESMVPLEFWKQ